MHLKLFLQAAQDATVEDYPGTLGIRKRPGLSPEEREVEARFAAQIERDPDGAMEEYLRRTGNVVSTDPARELWPDYLASNEARTRWSNAVYEPAKAVARAVYGRLLGAPVPPGKSDDVFFLAGGAGAGKTSSLASSERARALYSTAHIVVNGSMAGEAEADTMVQAALDAGKRVTIVYVHRPVEKATVGVIDRAIREGRTLPAEQISSLHYGAQTTVLNLARKHEGRVGFVVLDNSGDLGAARVSSLAELERVRYPSLEEVRQRVNETIQEERRRRAGTADAIPDAIFRSIRGADAPGASPTHRGDGPGEPA